MAGYGHYAQHGNNAVLLAEAQYEYRTQEKSANKTAKPVAQKNTRQAAKQIVKTSPGQAARPCAKRKTGVFSTLFVVVCCFAAFSFIIARYSVICATGNEINKLKSEINAMKEEANHYQLEISEKLDMAYIQEVARDKLKMGFPSEEQIVYVDLSEDTTEVAAENGENQVSKGDEKNINVLSESMNVLE